MILDPTQPQSPTPSAPVSQDAPAPQQLFAGWIDTPMDRMLAIACDAGLCLLEFEYRRALPRETADLEAHFGTKPIHAEHPILHQTSLELGEYFAGTRREFTIPLSTPGTPFQRQVWDQLRTIPYGSTRSYAQQAKAIGNPLAVRAVAKANGENRIAIIIPCHRVIGADGTLVGYGGGLPRKKKLLEHEGALGGKSDPRSLWSVAHSAIQ